MYIWLYKGHVHWAIPSLTIIAQLDRYAVELNSWPIKIYIRAYSALHAYYIIISTADDSGGKASRGEASRGEVTRTQMAGHRREQQRN